MGTILQALKSITAYPVPAIQLEIIASRRALSLTDQITTSVITSKKFRLAEADVKKWLSTSPSLSEGGVSINFTAKERDFLRSEANVTYDEYGDVYGNSDPVFGYKGEDL